jgi:hypothetical protein
MRALALLIGLCAAAPGLAQSSKPEAYGWQFEITPYLWLPGVSGTLQFGTPPGAGGSPEVKVGADQYLQNLDFALMLAGEARKGPWAVLTDVIYLDFSGETATVRTVTGPGGTAQTPVNANTQTGLKGLVWELALGYRVLHGGATTLEVLGGFRYLGLEATVDWQLAGALGLFPQAGSFSQKEELWDLIIGVRGKSSLQGSRWFVPYYLDIGSGSSVLTWQAAVGIGYAFRWGDALLAYRHLSYEQPEGKLLQDLAFSGPALGVTFRF